MTPRGASVCLTSSLMNSTHPAPRSLTIWKLSVATALVALLVAFILGHVWTAGTVWNHVTGARFSPWTNYVSDYAYRSPVWGIFVGCMYGLAALLGGLSLVIALRMSHRRVLAWLCGSLLAYAALKLCEVAIYPVKPPEVTAEQLQNRMDKPAWNRLTDELVEAASSIVGRESGRPTTAQEAIDGFVSGGNHGLGIKPAMLVIFVSMMLCPFLDPDRWKSPTKIGLLLLAMALVVCAAPFLPLFGEKVGLAQRVGFVGVYLWLWLNWFVTFGKKSAEPDSLS